QFGSFPTRRYGICHSITSLSYGIHCILGVCTGTLRMTVIMRTHFFGVISVMLKLRDSGHHHLVPAEMHRRSSAGTVAPQCTTAAKAILAPTIYLTLTDIHLASDPSTYLLFGG